MFQPLDEIAKTSIKILIQEPFYGHFMMGLPKEMNKEIPTAAVALMSGQMIKLMVNPNFWASLTPEQRYGLIKHEVLHIVLKHLITIKNYPNKRLYNIAADLCVNQYIKKEQLPEGGITLERFWHLKIMYDIVLLPNKDVGYYYNQLKKVLQMPPKKPLELGRTGQNGQPAPIDLNDLLNRENEELDRHRFWEAFAQLSEGERKVLEHQLNGVIKQTVNRLRFRYKNYGNLPAGLVEMLDEILAQMKPQFDWRRILRLFSASSKSSFLKNTIRRPSKRYGTTPGIKVKRRHKLLLAIDTSGSVSQKELSTFFQEIRHIWRQGAEIFIVECDAQIQAKYKYNGIAPTKIKGRGGTDFNPPILFANETYHPDAIIYFTDGCAPVPQVPIRSPILWVISARANDYFELKDLPGRVVEMT